MQSADSVTAKGIFDIMPVRSLDVQERAEDENQEVRLKDRLKQIQGFWFRFEECTTEYIGNSNCTGENRWNHVILVYKLTAITHKHHA